MYIRGLSIGYDTLLSDFVDGVRHLKELRLWEGSVVTFPMNEMATVTSIKMADEDDEELAALKQVFDSLQALVAILQR